MEKLKFNYENNTLTISGNGAMPNFRYNTMPWYSYRYTIESVEISEGITSVGRCAFNL